MTACSMRASAIALTMLTLVTPLGARAADLTVGSGWQGDVVSSSGQASDTAPFTFTLDAGHYVFTLTDEFGPGDIYSVTVNGGTPYTSDFGLLATNFDNSTGPEAPYAMGSWLDPTFSRLQLSLSQGSYSISVTTDCSNGCPAEFGYRLDSIGVPEPAAWIMMLIGFASLGVALRSQRSYRLAPL